MSEHEPCQYCGRSIPTGFGAICSACLGKAADLHGDPRAVIAARDARACRMSHKPLVFSNLLAAQDWEDARWILVRDDGDRLYAYNGYPTLEEAEAQLAREEVMFPALDRSKFRAMEKPGGPVRIEPRWVPGTPCMAGR